MSLINTLEQELAAEIAEIQEQIKRIKLFLEEAPPGALRISNSKEGRPRYYHIGGGAGEKYDKYLSKKRSSDTITALAKKDYYERLLVELNEERAALEKAYNKVNGDPRRQVYTSLRRERRNLVDNVFPSGEERCKKWMEKKPS